MTPREAAELLERVAIGDEGEAREQTIARLMAHSRLPYASAVEIAEHAVFARARSLGLVFEAAAVLGIAL